MAPVLRVLGLALAALPATLAFHLPLRTAVTPARASLTCAARISKFSLASVASPESEADVEAAVEGGKDVLKSDVGLDYVPLATMLLTGDFEGADQFTRDALIKIGGAGSQKRGYVYWTEVKNLPLNDLKTIESLWLKYSKGKFGYSVQHTIWNQSTVRGDFEKFCRKVGWNKMDESGMERKLKWFGKSEFIYDLEKAPPGHLPLTNTLRGTTLLKAIVTLPLWDTNWQEEA